MTVVDNGADTVAAPKNYADLHRQYYTYVVAFVHKLGIHEDNAEDVASDILLRFYERNFLAEFDPTLTFSYKGKVYPARFKNFLSQFVFQYARGHLDKQRRTKRRERTILNAEVSAQMRGQMNAWMVGDILLPLIDDHADSVHDQMVADDLVTELRDYLKTIPPRNEYDMLDLVALFDEVVAQIYEFGEYNTTKLREKFNVSHTAMFSWIWLLRGHLCACLNRELPAKRPRTLAPRKKTFDFDLAQDLRGLT